MAGTRADSTSREYRRAPGARLGTNPFCPAVSRKSPRSEARRVRNRGDKRGDKRSFRQGAENIFGPCGAIRQIGGSSLIVQRFARAPMADPFPPITGTSGTNSVLSPLSRLTVQVSRINSEQLCVLAHSEICLETEGSMAHKEQVGEQLLDTIDGTARRLGVGRSSVYQLIKDKQLEAVKIGRSVRIPIDSTIALVQRLRGAA